MSVQIETKFNMIVLDHFEQKLFYCVNLRFFELVRVGVTSVKIFTSGVGSEIALVNAVWVYDWNDVKNKFFQKKVGLL
jgi:hypothetical protein